MLRARVWLTWLQDSVLHLVLRLRGGGGGPVNPELGLAAGGLIKQTIVKDTVDPSRWAPEYGTIFNVQILNSEFFKEVTGIAPPSTPVTAVTYAEHGYPYFSIYDEQPTDIHGNFDVVQSVNQLDRTGHLSEEKVHAAAEVSKNTHNPVVLLDVNGKPRGFRTVADLERDVRNRFKDMFI